jgi:predicted aspartyl protease
MGLTYVHARLRRSEGRGPIRDVRFLVDSGAIYSVLPEDIWRSLRLKPERQVEFTLADGTAIARGVSECRFEIRGESATSPVVLGEKDDGALLVAVTLETLGFMLNPLTREILPMRMRYPICTASGRPIKAFTGWNPQAEMANSNLVREQFA